MNKIISLSRIPFLNKPKSKVALDIGATYVKLLSLTASGGGNFQADYFSVKQLETGCSREKLVDAVREAVRAADGKIQRVVISVSGPAVVVRQILFPLMTEEELKSAITFEVEKYIPFNINDVYLDARIIDRKAQEGKIKVLIVAAKKTLIDEMMGLLKEAGLEPESIDCDSIALTNAFLFNNPGLSKDKTIALVNVEPNMTNVCILKDEILNFVRDIPIETGNRDNLETQIRLSFDYYENQFGKGIDGMYVSGGGLKTGGLIEQLLRAFGIETLIWDSTKNLNVSKNIDPAALKEAAGQMAVCVGLAMRQ